MLVRKEITFKTGFIACVSCCDFKLYDDARKLFASENAFGDVEGAEFIKQFSRAGKDVEQH